MLKTAHKILISAAIVLGILLVLYSAFQYLSNGDASYVPMGAIGAVVSVVLTFYLRWFSTKNRAQSSGSA
jgi:high-affinity Fe2+/Pb2+ permease